MTGFDCAFDLPLIELGSLDLAVEPEFAFALRLLCFLQFFFPSASSADLPGASFRPEFASRLRELLQAHPRLDSFRDRSPATWKKLLPLRHTAPASTAPLRDRNRCPHRPTLAWSPGDIRSPPRCISCSPRISLAQIVMSFRILVILSQIFLYFSIAFL